MALDIITHEKNGTVSRYEFPEGLHQAIFKKDLKIKKNNALYSVKDYYLTDHSFEGQEIVRLAGALALEKPRLEASHREELSLIIDILNNINLASVSFAGD